MINNSKTQFFVHVKGVVNAGTRGKSLPEMAFQIFVQTEFLKRSKRTMLIVIEKNILDNNIYKISLGW